MILLYIFIALFDFARKTDSRNSIESVNIAQVNVTWNWHYSKNYDNTAHRSFVRLLIKSSGIITTGMNRERKQPRKIPKLILKRNFKLILRRRNSCSHSINDVNCAQRLRGKYAS